MCLFLSLQSLLPFSFTRFDAFPKIIWYVIKTITFLEKPRHSSKPEIVTRERAPNVLLQISFPSSEMGRKWMQSMNAQDCTLCFVHTLFESQHDGHVTQNSKRMLRRHAKSRDKLHKIDSRSSRTCEARPTSCSLF